jgi:tryptophan-rich sensory protein
MILARPWLYLILFLGEIVPGLLAYGVAHNLPSEALQTVWLSFYIARIAGVLWNPMLSSVKNPLSGLLASLCSLLCGLIWMVFSSSVLQLTVSLFLIGLGSAK